MLTWAFKLMMKAAFEVTPHKKIELNCCDQKNLHPILFSKL